MSPSTSYICAYCGSSQTATGDGTRVCTHCGATQPERGSTPGSTAATPARKTGRIVLLSLLIVAALLAGLIAYGHHIRTGSAAAPAPIVDAANSRLIRVLNPAIRTVPPGSNLTAEELLRSAPDESGTLFDPKQFAVKPLRRVFDVVDNKVYYIGEVTNTSNTIGALAPDADIVFFKHGAEVHAEPTTFPDLPPGASIPTFFTWAGDETQFDRVAVRWKPGQSYAVGAPHANLTTAITKKNLGRSDTIINFQAPIYYTTATVSGTVTNGGNATADNVQLYLILRDRAGRITGFKEKDLTSLAPGATTTWDTGADQWDDAVATVEAIAYSSSATPL